MVVPMKLAATTCLIELRSDVWPLDVIAQHPCSAARLISSRKTA
jgi:hypothetical protein